VPPRGSRPVTGAIVAGLLAGIGDARSESEQEPRADVQAPVPTIAIIIDDIGNNLIQGVTATELPGQITISVLPHTTYAAQIAENAHHLGKEVMLHMPMESKQRLGMGPGGLSGEMDQETLQSEVHRNLDSVPYVAGLNNHMGSLLTTNQQAMDWVMDAVAAHGALFYLDSRTTHSTLAERTAKAHGIPNSARDIFLDNDRNSSAIAAQFLKLVELARTKGYAVAIGHPYPETLQVLDEELPLLQQMGIRLVSASEMIKLQESMPWPEPSSPLHRVAKNSKQ